MSLHYIFSYNSENTSTGIFHWLELIAVIQGSLKIFSLKKTLTSFFNILENLQENESRRLVFWKVYTFPLKKVRLWQYIAQKNQLLNFTIIVFLEAVTSHLYFVNFFSTNNNSVNYSRRPSSGTNTMKVQF